MFWKIFASKVDKISSLKITYKKYLRRWPKTSKKNKVWHNFAYFLQKLWEKGVVLPVVIGATALAFAKNELLHM